MTSIVIYRNLYINNIIHSTVGNENCIGWDKTNDIDK